MMGTLVSYMNSDAALLFIFPSYSMTESEQIFKPIQYKLPVFQQVEVTSSYNGLQLPKKIWTFTSGGLMPLMIRQEFHDGLTAILQWIERSFKYVCSLDPIDYHS
jgi:hypothetical protein